MLIAAAIRLASPRELPHHLPLTFFLFLSTVSPSLSVSLPPFLLFFSFLLYLPTFFFSRCHPRGWYTELYDKYTYTTYTCTDRNFDYRWICFCVSANEYFCGSVHNAIQLYTFFPSVYIEYEDIYIYIYKSTSKTRRVKSTTESPSSGSSKAGRAC